MWNGMDETTTYSSMLTSWKYVSSRLEYKVGDCKNQEQVDSQKASDADGCNSLQNKL